MKVLIVNKFLHPNGGSETYIFEIGAQLKKMGHEAEYFGMEHENRKVGNRVQSYTSDMDFHSGKLARVLYPFKIIYSFEAQKRIRAVLEDFMPDVVHLNNFTYQITPSILYEIRKFEKRTGHKIKIVATVHDPQLVCPNHLLINGKTKEACELCLGGKFRYCMKGKCIHDSFSKSLLGALESRIYRSLHTYRMIDTVICPSLFMEEKIKKNPDLCGRTVMLRNFLSLKNGDFSRPQENGLDLPDSYVLYLGRFSKEKGMETLRKAVRNLPHIPFVFAGSGPYEEEIKKEKNIINLGFVDRKLVPVLLKNAAFSLITSECFENCPFSVMESQMCKTPVIGSRIGGIPELIREGVDGDLFECGNDKELAHKIETLWKDDKRRKQYHEACKKIKYDSLDEYCEKLIEIYG